MKNNQAKTRSEIQEHIDGLSDRIQRLEEKTQKTNCSNNRTLTDEKRLS